MLYEIPAFITVMINFIAQKSLEDMRHIYFQLKEQVLKGKGIIANYLGFCDSQRLEEIFVDELFGTEMRMTDKLHPK